jgi:hypothetical protein
MLTLLAERALSLSGQPRYTVELTVPNLTMVAGQREHVDALWDEVANVLAPIGLRLSVENSRVVHIDEGFDLLGWPHRPVSGGRGEA